MPVYHSHRAIFVHVPKTAGTSVVRALSVACGEAEFDQNGLWEHLVAHDPDGVLVRMLRNVYPINTLSNFPQQHLPARVLSRILPPETWARYFKFAFVRNPWAMLVSMYSFLRQLVASDAAIRAADPDRAAQVERMQSFEQFVRSYRLTGTDMSAMLLDEDGSPLLDYVGRVETIERDFAYIGERLGINAVLPRENASGHADYRQFYTNETRAIAAQIFARDIESFGYSF